MTMCAGVQKVSRPMVSCQEMSHMMPTVMQEAASARTKAGQNAGTLPACCVAGGLEVSGSDSEIPCMACGFVLDLEEFSQSQRSGRTVKCRAGKGSGSMPFATIESSIFPA